LPCVKQAFLFDDRPALTHIGLMRFLRFLPFLLILPAGAWPLVNGQASMGGAGVIRDLAPSANEQRDELDQFFANLRYSEDAQDAAEAEAEIFIRLSASKSPTISLLLESASAALENEDTDAAKRIMADVVGLDPGFAEGLTRAASLAYQDDELEEAERLLKRALALEPRHFGAWAGYGMVLEDLGDLKGAQKAYREALYLHPFLDNAKRGLTRVDAKVDGLSL
jgi:tetratricopeptide (TPR) repeat protein